MKTLLDRLDGLANNMRSAIYDDAETCGETAAELRRLHEVNQELLEALKELVVVATHEKPGSTCLMKANAAIAKGEQA